MKQKMTIPPELEGEYIIRVMDLPDGSRGFILYDDDDFANIYINAHLSHEGQRKTTGHEFVHLLNDDIHNDDDIKVIEARANGKGDIFKAIPKLMKARDLIPPSARAAITDNAKPPEQDAPEFQPTAYQISVIRHAIDELDRIMFSDRPYDYL